MKSHRFATFERSLLEAVVKDTLSIKEVNLFKAVRLGAKNECKRKGLTNDGENKRILGESIVKGIRFPVMKQDEFANVVIDSKILTPEEVFAFFKYYSSTLNSPLEFSESLRGGLHGDNICRCSRFQCVQENDWDYGGSAADCIDFTVDKDIMLHGLCLFGSENNNYSVSFTIKETGSHLALPSKTGAFSSKLLQYANGNYYGFEVLFDSTVECRKNTKYEIVAIVSGPTSWVGHDGVSSVVCSGVTFTFRDNAKYGNGTCTGRGQFPEILFSVLS